MLRKNKYILLSLPLASTQTVLPILEGRTCRKFFNKCLQGETNCQINKGLKREEFCCSESCSEHVLVTEIEPDLTPPPGRNMKCGTTDHTQPFPTWGNSTNFSRIAPFPPEDVTCPGVLPHYTPVVSTDTFNNLRKIVHTARRSPAPGRRWYPTATHHSVPAWTSYSLLMKGPWQDAVSFNSHKASPTVH